MELPPYRMPTAKVVLRHTWEKGKQYLKKMGGIIMVASIIIWFLGYYPNHEAYETTAEQQENSYIGQLGKAIEPAIEPLGFDWKMGIGILSGIGAKELVVSTLGVLYTNEDDVDTVDLSERSLRIHVVRTDLLPVYCHLSCHQAGIRWMEMGRLCRDLHHHISLACSIRSLSNRKFIHLKLFVIWIFKTFSYILL